MSDSKIVWSLWWWSIDKFDKSRRLFLWGVASLSASNMAKPIMWILDSSLANIAIIDHTDPMVELSTRTINNMFDQLKFIPTLKWNSNLRNSVDILLWNHSIPQLVFKTSIPERASLDFSLKDYKSSLKSEIAYYQNRIDSWEQWDMSYPQSRIDYLRKKISFVSVYDDSSTLHDISELYFEKIDEYQQEYLQELVSLVSKNKSKAKTFILDLLGSATPWHSPNVRFTFTCEQIIDTLLNSWIEKDEICELFSKLELDSVIKNTDFWKYDDIKSNLQKNITERRNKSIWDLYLSIEDRLETINNILFNPLQDMNQDFIKQLCEEKESIEYVMYGGKGVEYDIEMVRDRYIEKSQIIKNS